MNAQAQDVQQEVAYINQETGQVLTREQVYAHKKDQLQKLYSFFAGMRDKWVQHRSSIGVEGRWRKANKLYHGDPAVDATSLEATLRDGPTNANRQASKAQAPRSKVVVNIVRPKVEQAVARMCEILFPVDDRNWGIRPTPLPELDSRLGNPAPTVDPTTGQPTGLTADEEAQAIMKAAKEASDHMQRSIDDSLTECDFNGECRKLIEDGVRLGTGIIMGPFPKRSSSKRWTHKEGVSKLEIQQKIAPASARLDPWDVFFDPACGNDHQRGRGVWIRRPNTTRKDLRALCGVPGFDEECIKEVLLSQPARVRVAEGRVSRDFINDDSYEMWTYHGEVEAEELVELSERISSDKHPDPLKDVSNAMLVMVNDRVVGALDSWIEDGSMPVDIWTWRKSDDSPYGHSLPEELEHQQGVVNAAWRQVMDNARNTLGGQIVMRQNGIIPANGVYELTPMKVWLAKDDVIDVTKSFATFEFSSHIDELLKIAQAAMAFSDLESGIPQLMGGEQGTTAPETLGGMVLLYNNANAVLRRRVKMYDDQVTRPHLGRYYDFKMANDPDDRIKGDFNVDARGSSTLVERDIQNQAMINLASITSNPRYAPWLKERDELKAILKAFKINPDDLLKTEQEFQKQQQEQQPQQDPRIVSAQAMFEAKKLDIADREKEREFEAQRNATDDGFRNRQLQYNSQREQAEFEIAQTDSSIKRDTALLRENNSMQISREANASRERLGTLKIETDRQIFNAEAQLRVQTGSGI